MKHAGRARQAALKLILWALVALILVLGAGVVAIYVVSAFHYIAIGLVVLWLLFAGFTFYFFRDPHAKVPATANAVLSPAHGKVDVIDQVDEAKFMGGRCQRISIFLSVI